MEVEARERKGRGRGRGKGKGGLVRSIFFHHLHRNKSWAMKVAKRRSRRRSKGKQRKQIVVGGGGEKSMTMDDVGGGIGSFQSEHLLQLQCRPDLLPFTFPRKQRSFTFRKHRPWSSWASLPEAIGRMVLERLPLRAYIRFGAVCRRWLEIQRCHRLVHVPSPPPYIPLPWFIVPRGEGGPSRILSPFDDHRPANSGGDSLRGEGEDHSINLRNPCMLPETWGIPYQLGFKGSSRGWLLLSDFHELYLYNPISIHTIQLPRLPYPDLHRPFVARLRRPPDYVVYIFMANRLFLIREDDDEWTMIFEVINDRRVHSHALDFPVARAICCSNGDLYCLWKDWGIFVVHPRPKPTLQELEMDTSQLPSLEIRCRSPCALVESGGELLVVLILPEVGYKNVECRVFKADIYKKMWTRMESLGDQLLILPGNTLGVSLPAASLDNNFKANCIYLSPTDHKRPWMMFDLDSGEASECPFLGTSMYFSCMFVPSLC